MDFSGEKLKKQLNKMIPISVIILGILLAIGLIAVVVWRSCKSGCQSACKSCRGHDQVTITKPLDYSKISRAPKGKAGFIYEGRHLVLSKESARKKGRGHVRSSQPLAYPRKIRTDLRYLTNLRGIDLSGITIDNSDLVSEVIDQGQNGICAVCSSAQSLQMLINARAGKNLIRRNIGYMIDQVRTGSDPDVCGSGTNFGKVFSDLSTQDILPPHDGTTGEYFLSACSTINPSIANPSNFQLQNHTFSDILVPVGQSLNEILVVLVGGVDNVDSNGNIIDKTKRGTVLCALKADNPNGLEEYSGGIVGDVTGSPDHAVLIIGYNPNYQGTQVFLVQNSWGAGWGILGGKFYIKTSDILADNNDHTLCSPVNVSTSDLQNIINNSPPNPSNVSTQLYHHLGDTFDVVY